jgi:membrane protein YdbS with pleckstrin-like domain
MIAVNQGHATAEKWVNFVPMYATVVVAKICYVRIAHLAPWLPHRYHEKQDKTECYVTY